MPAHPSTSVLFFYVLGKLHEAHATAIDRHLRNCARCQDLCHGVENDTADLALVLAPAPVPPWMRDGLLHNAREVHRLTDAVPALRQALRCSQPRAGELLDKIDNPAHWRRIGEAWVMPIAQRRPRGAALIRLGARARYTAPRADALKVHVLQGFARGSAGPLRAGRALSVGPRCRFGAYPGPDVLLLLTWVRTVKTDAVASSLSSAVAPTLSTADQSASR